ncbi:hypothetical protein G6F53_013602 [Rhizopus delemar]|nr:hypothetical protein G6F54_013624 [Rhizopus delemar]KAG1488321.1 hypothetical protein G6F53_013602 [Rhizopus delemar]
MVSLNVDWFQPSDGMHYSCGGVYLTINNLPRSSRMKVSNIILVGMIPGPGEPTDDQLQNFMRPMIAELNTLYGGIMRMVVPLMPSDFKISNFLIWKSIIFGI